MTALRYMNAKGYDCGMYDAVNHENTRIVHERDGVARYSIPEHAIWDAHEQYCLALEAGENPWGPFAEYALQERMETLLNEVV